MWFLFVVMAVVSPNKLDLVVVWFHGSPQILGAQIFSLVTCVLKNMLLCISVLEIKQMSSKSSRSFYVQFSNGHIKCIQQMNKS